ncbi:hypothetical protein GN244_ATG07211 [Phytophthora infestans]|uniref:Transmembrane protein n=1 Tax=Phytophthora infestans TaxID=4787 RepID=A0A833WG09_PHYIN|nr:hypothetical protein GN244_ATG07211 [Phytophthora infestans]KAF4135784.1 hypothetical protein GN958_ATG15008 [Phytophthora infestans]
MVVLHHNELDRTLWGPASTTGRSRATDIVIFIQLAVVALLGVTCALDYDKPEAARLAAAGATLLMYFRSIGLFMRLMLFVSAIVFYGDIIVPIVRLARESGVFPLATVKLILHSIWVCNSLRILLAIFQSETLRPGQRKKRPMPSRMHAVPNKMRQKVA